MAKARKLNTASKHNTVQQGNNIDPAILLVKKNSDKDTGAKQMIILFLLSFFLYANTLHHGFVLDDVSAIQQNMLVRKGFAGISELLRTPYHYGYVAPIPGEKLNDLYRPISLVLFAIEFQLSNDNPLIGHLVNLLLYASCVLLLFQFIKRLFRNADPMLPFLACMLFAVHPVHTEVVANIKSTDELLCFIFAILSFLQLIIYIDFGKALNLICSILFFFLSLLSKETAITMLAIYPCIYFFYENRDKKRVFIASGWMVLTAALYLLIRVAVLMHYDSFNPAAIKFIDNQLVAAPGLWSRYATAILVLGKYLKLLFIPHPLICDYSYPSVPFASFSDMWVILSLLIYGGLIVWTCLRLWKRKFDAMTFGILFYLVTISVFSNLFLLIGSIMGERFLFFPSAGFCIAITALVLKLLNKNEHKNDNKLLPNARLSIPFFIVCFVYGVLTLQRSKEWKDNQSLYEADCAKSPKNYRLLLYLSGIEVNEIDNSSYTPQEKRDKYNEVAVLLHRSIDAYPESSESLAALADVYIDLEKFDSAIYYGRMAMKYTAYSWLAEDAIAVGCIQTGRQEEARQVLRLALNVAPENPEISGNMASSFMMSRQYDSAIYYLGISRAIAPGLRETNMLLSEAFKALGQNDSALKYEQRARRN